MQTQNNTSQPGGPLKGASGYSGAFGRLGVPSGVFGPTLGSPRIPLAPGAWVPLAVIWGPSGALGCGIYVGRLLHFVERNWTSFSDESQDITAPANKTAVILTASVGVLSEAAAQTRCPQAQGVRMT